MGIFKGGNNIAIHLLAGGVPKDNLFFIFHILSSFSPLVIKILNGLYLLAGVCLSLLNNIPVPLPPISQYISKHTILSLERKYIIGIWGERESLRSHFFNQWIITGLLVIGVLWINFLGLCVLSFILDTCKTAINCSFLCIAN